MTVKEAAKELGIGAQTLHDWHKNGKMEIITVSYSDRYVSIEEVNRLKESKIPKDMKKCKMCGLVAMKDKFVKDRFVCNECRPQYQRNKNIKNKDKRKVYKKEYYKRKAVRKHVNIKQREYKYGITREQYEEMQVKANGKCDLCGQESNKLCLDHDHSTNKVRGLVCNACNLGLGHFKDNTEKLQLAIEYLQRTTSSDVDDEVDYSALFFAGVRGALPSFV